MNAAARSSLKLTETQMSCLRWLHANGGKACCKPAGLYAGTEFARHSWFLPFLILMTKGAVETKDGLLQISDAGYDVLARAADEQH